MQSRTLHTVDGGCFRVSLGSIQHPPGWCPRILDRPRGRVAEVDSPIFIIYPWPLTCYWPDRYYGVRQPAIKIPDGLAMLICKASSGLDENSRG